VIATTAQMFSGVGATSSTANAAKMSVAQPVRSAILGGRNLLINARPSAGLSSTGSPMRRSLAHPTINATQKVATQVLAWIERDMRSGESRPGRSSSDIVLKSVHVRSVAQLMKSITYTAARNQLAKAITQVNEDHAQLLITRQKGAPAVLMSLEDFHSWEETAYLLRSPENARRLESAIKQLEAGKGRRRNLLSPGPTKPGKTTSGSRSTTPRSIGGSTASSKRSTHAVRGHRQTRAAEARARRLLVAPHRSGTPARL
jgi:antitoxin YefM